MNNQRALFIIGVVIAVLVALPVGWYLISPLFINRAVDEALPAAEATQAMEEAMAESTQAVDEAMPPGDMAAMQILAQGEFYNIAHEGRGKATIYQLPDGSRILRFEGFEVLNGPDLHVYLASGNPVPDTVGVELAGSVDLGKLKGNIGNQNYELPADLDLSQFQSVVIWCQPFRVPFAAAPLTTP